MFLRIERSKSSSDLFLSVLKIQNRVMENYIELQPMYTKLRMYKVLDSIVYVLKQDQ